MSRATIIDGKAIAAALRREVAAGVAELERERGITPGLAVVLVGEDPASQVYVRNKAQAPRARRACCRSSTSCPPTRPRPRCWR